MARTLIVQSSVSLLTSVPSIWDCHVFTERVGACAVVSRNAWVVVRDGKKKADVWSAGWRGWKQREDSSLRSSYVVRRIATDPEIIQNTVLGTDQRTEMETVPRKPDDPRIYSLSTLRGNKISRQRRSFRVYVLSLSFFFFSRREGTSRIPFELPSLTPGSSGITSSFLDRPLCSLINVS